MTRNVDGSLRLSPASDRSLSIDVCGGWAHDAGAMLYQSHGGENQKIKATAAEKRRMDSRDRMGNQQKSPLQNILDASSMLVINKLIN